jgi:hypothetical protein
MILGNSNDKAFSVSLKKDIRRNGMPGLKETMIEVMEYILRCSLTTINQYKAVSLFDNTQFASIRLEKPKYRQWSSRFRNTRIMVKQKKGERAKLSRHYSGEKVNLFL